MSPLLQTIFLFVSISGHSVQSYWSFNTLLSIDGQERAVLSTIAFVAFFKYLLIWILPCPDPIAVLFQIIPGPPICLFFHMNFSVSFCNSSKQSVSIFIESILNE